MILPNVRASFSRTEAAHLVNLLGRDGEAARRSAVERLESGGLDALLDDPRVLNALLTDSGVSAPPALVFYVLIRHALLEGGIDEVEIADYVTALVLGFARSPRPYRIDEEDDEEYHYLVDLVAAMDEATGRRSFLIRAHLGNYSLWLSGLFPDYIEARVQRRGAPPLRYYEEMGATGFRLASETSVAQAYGIEDVLHGAAQRFPALRVALNRVADRHFWPRAGDPVARVLREVRDRFREGNRP